MQLGSCDHVVRGISPSGGHVVLRNLHQEGKTGITLRENRLPPGQRGHCDFIPCLLGHHNGQFLNYESFVNPNTNIVSLIFLSSSFTFRKDCTVVSSKFMKRVKNTVDPAPKTGNHSSPFTHCPSLEVLSSSSPF